MALKIKIIIQYKNISILSPELLPTFVLANPPSTGFITSHRPISTRPGDFRLPSQKVGFSSGPHSIHNLHEPLCPISNRPGGPLRFPLHKGMVFSGAQPILKQHKIYNRKRCVLYGAGRPRVLKSIGASLSSLNLLRPQANLNIHRPGRSLIIGHYRN
jgi:hypothetical protein